MSDIEHVAIGNRAGRRRRSQGSWREHEAVRVIKGKLRTNQRVNGAAGDAGDIDGQTERPKWAVAHESTRPTSEFQFGSEFVN